MPSDLDTVCRALQIDPESFCASRPRWPDSCDTLPNEGPVFLDPGRVVEYARYCRLSPDLEGPLVDTAKRITDSPHLRPLLWHLHRELYEQADAPTGDWPEIQPLRAQRGLFYLLLALAMVPLVREVHARKSIDTAVTRDTCLQIGCFLLYHRTGCDGRPGVLVAHLGWLRHYVAGCLFRLGRLEYMLRPAPHGERLFRHRGHHTLVMLMPPEIPLDHEGYALRPEAEGAVAHTLYEETENAYVGCPVDPSGVAEAAPIRLTRSDWDPVWRPGEPLIDMHIPAGGGMTAEATLDSFQRAFTFFADPTKSSCPRVIRCVSWIFNPQLATDLPDSNFARFLPELYLFPFPSPPNAGFHFVFCRDYADWSAAPRSTRLQRLLLNWYVDGRGLRHGGMLVLEDDLIAWGTQVYRRRHGPRAVREGTP